MKEAYREHTPKIDASADWVCLNCSNLNYSFRKVCNRCRTITRQQNHQNYLQMQYIQAYYHPFRQEEPLPNELSPTNSAYLCPTHLPNHLPTLTPSDEIASSFIKGPFNAQQELPPPVKTAQWSTESGFMFLLENAWEDLYASSQVSEFKGCEEGEKTRQEEDDYENEDILSNFDLTFI